MQPTADTLLVIYFQRLGAAGDWRRSAARVSKIPDGDLRLATTRGSFTHRRIHCVAGAALRIILGGAWWEARASCCTGRGRRALSPPRTRTSQCTRPRTRGMSSSFLGLRGG
jgi:hypothetical protein